MKKILIIVILLGLMSGCTISSKIPSTDQHLIVAEQFDLRGYDPGSTMSDFIRALIFNNLVELDADFNKVASLATHWDKNDDATVWTFELREGVTFHDGEPMNADAVKFNLDFRKETTGKSWLSNMKEVRVLDEYRVEIELFESNITFDSDLTPPFLAIVSPMSVNDQYEVVEAVGTGPFMLDFWQKDQQFSLIRNENYYDGKPKLKRITFKVIFDAQTRALALENNEVHLMSGREALSVVARLQDHKDILIHSRTGQTSEMMYFNTTEGPLADVLVRKAIISQIDLTEAVESLLTNMAVKPTAFFSKAFNPYVADIQIHKKDSLKLLETAGFTQKNAQGILMNEDQPLSLRLVLGANNEEDKLLSIVIADQLKQIGIDVQLVLLESGALRDALNKKEYDLIMIGQWLIPHDEPTTHYLKGYWHSESSYKIYVSDELDGMIELLHTSLDENQRILYHHQIQQHITDVYAQMVIFHRNNVVLTQKNVSDFEVSVGTWQIYRGLVKAYLTD